MKTDSGSFKIAKLRDREGSFKPPIVKKRKTLLPKDIERGILSTICLWSKRNKLSNYLKYQEGIRRIIYTTNAIKGFKRQLQKIIKTKGAFFSQEALLKFSYLAIKNIVKK